MKKTLLATTLMVLILGFAWAEKGSAQRAEVTAKPSTIQTQRELKPEQAKARFMGQIEAEMKRKNTLKNGWHEAFNVPEGRVFAYVQGGRVLHLAVSGNSGSSPKILAFLSSNVTGSNADLYDRGLNISDQPNTGGGGDPSPTKDECSRMILRCLLATIDVFKVPAVFSSCETGNVYTCAKAVVDALDPPKKSAKCEACIQMLFPD